MSENAVVAAETVAPATEVVVETPNVSAPVAGNTIADVKHSASANAIERFRAQMNAKTEAKAANETPDVATPDSLTTDARGNVHDATGKFAPKTAAEIAAEITPDPANTPAAITPPAGMVRIELPADHPMRDQGITFVDALPDQERAIRAAINTPIKRREVEEARRMAGEEKLARMRVEAQAAALQEQIASVFKSPERAEYYRELAAVNQDVADSYLHGELAKLQEQVNGKMKEADAAFQQEQANQGAAEFGRNTYTAVKNIGIENWWIEQNLQSEMAAFGYRLQMGLEQPTIEAATEFVRKQYLSHPQVREHYGKLSASQRNQEAERIRAEAATNAANAARQQEAERLKNAANVRSTLNPIGQVGSTIQSGVRTTPAAPETPVGQSAGQLKNSLAARVRERMSAVTR